MHIYEMNGKRPRIHKTALVLQGAVVAGDVVIGPGALISWNAIVYAEEATLEIGEGVCVGDGALVHAKENPIHVAAFALIGHGAQICDANVEHHAMVGINAVVVDGACVAERSMLAGDSFLRGEKTTPGMMWGGRPAVEIRPWKVDPVGEREARAHARMAIFGTMREINLAQAQVE